ncbi:hypothetical protein HGRIS_014208 [Hohenbuehelia grisea]|uniref:UBX domain-containing protein n=1 Tax=Hohenbuehelia grisea TaxID=104357 RepID=A0ABR3JSS9_9AGAR
MEALTDTQREALAQIRDLTNGADDQVSIDVLSSVGWDVQSAAELLFGQTTSSPTRADEPDPPRASTSSATTEPLLSRMERFEVDDTQQGGTSTDIPRPRNSQTLPTGPWALIPRPILSVLALPFHLFSSLFRFIFGVLRLPLPTFNLHNIYTRRARRPTHSEGRERWVRELEEETGALCVSHYRNGAGAVASGAEAGPSSVKARGTAGDLWADGNGKKLLPDFYLGTYEEALRVAQAEARIACAILVSEEHDDVAEFKRSTLTDPTFVKKLHDNNILVWGGDVRDQEAWGAAEKLQATTYPFVAFIALQPRRNISLSDTRTSSTTTTPLLTVLSRHQGRCLPASAPTSATSLCSHLDAQLFPRVLPFLERIRTAERERVHDRQLRAEQDRAFHEAARRDKDRIEAKMREEREKEERRRAAEEEAAIAEAQRISAEEARARQAARRMDVRRWARRAVAGGAATSGGSLRVAVRLPDGSRIIKAFADTATLTVLYACVDAALIPPHLTPSTDPSSPPSGLSTTTTDPLTALESEIGGDAEWWGFQLVLAYPRKVVPWHAGVRLNEVDGLSGGGQVVVEMLNGSRQQKSGSPGKGKAAATAEEQEHDGYETESSDED